ncbi:hypothetical protein VTL71DRAFT_312 [Oculimacula yallundae]|uniref:Uncharacterized protein n=1 Tax=Oculimacula yallundae TaxID=86028 RepID=A0ABR4CZQ6_9HELO
MSGRRKAGISFNAGQNSDKDRARHSRGVRFLIAQSSPGCQPWLKMEFGKLPFLKCPAESR